MRSLPRGRGQGVSPRREQAMRQLSAACLDGRITPRELASRVAAAQAAVTIAGLRRTTRDLPTPASGAVAGARCRARRLLLEFLAVRAGGRTGRYGRR